jgi:uncharacterized protein (DUF305 family)
VLLTTKGAKVKENILYGVIGLLAGIVLTWAFASTGFRNNNQDMMRMMGYRPNSMMNNNMEDTMHGMMGGISNKNGDDFDQAFISQMITHHQGAINMAEQALKDAKHQEIKDLSKEIIEAQTKEIDLMKQWREDWY